MAKKQISNRADYLQLNVRKSEFDDLFVPLGKMLGVDNIEARGEKSRIIYFALRFTFAILAAIGDEKTRTALVNRVREPLSERHKHES